MGDIAEMMLDGSLRQECGCVIGDGNGEGFPAYCDSCLKQNVQQRFRIARDIAKRKPKSKKLKEVGK